MCFCKCQLGGDMLKCPDNSSLTFSGISKTNMKQVFMLSFQIVMKLKQWRTNTIKSYQRMCVIRITCNISEEMNQLYPPLLPPRMTCDITPCLLWKYTLFRAHQLYEYIHQRIRL